jgi:hypothetical protein
MFCQNDWKHLHHVRISKLELISNNPLFVACPLGNLMVSCVNFFLLLFTIGFRRNLLNRLQNEWKKASVMADILLNENNWSKATYCYLLATFMFEDNHGIATDEIIKLYK